MKVTEYVGLMVERFPDTKFDFHAHNDYDMAISNVFAAVMAGVNGLHTTINGLGERAGNASLASVQAILNDQLAVKTNINEERLMAASRMVESFSGIAVASNQPIVGENVFTQVAGVHADGDKKNNLYCNKLLPERFGRKREYALGKNSGKANILKNLEELGLELTSEQTRRVTDRIIELGDKKQIVTQEDLPYIVSDVLKHSAPNEKVKLLSYMVSTAYGLKPMAKLVGWGQGGVDPKIMGVGPVAATKNAMAKSGLTVDDMDLIEANEAFAAQSIAVARELKFDMSKVNVNGGAISLGHPVGCSGARIIVTLIHEMLKREDAKLGLATLCIGGGMGVATIWEKC